MLRLEFQARELQRTLPVLTLCGERNHRDLVQKLHNALLHPLALLAESCGWSGLRWRHLRWRCLRWSWLRGGRDVVLRLLNVLILEWDDEHLEHGFAVGDRIGF